MTGLYIHIPFCLQKCPYCDFYSVAYDNSAAYAYADAVIRNVLHYNERYDTIYFGGGTPSAAWWDVCRIMGKLRFSELTEITVEANPDTLTRDSLSAMRSSGVNRLSVGVQSFSNAELGAIGRSHTSEDAQNAIRFARESGFENISVDLMLGIPHQTPASVRRSIKVLSGLDITHVSAYMLKLEDGRSLAKMAGIPDENMTAQIYLAAADALEKCGFVQYEVSNFAIPSFECRHNLKYWKSHEYLGIGAASHSYFGDERFCVASDVDEFVNSAVQNVVSIDKEPVGFADYAMLKLRLTEGLSFAECAKFGVKKLDMLKRCKLVPPDYLKISTEGVAITREGFLVSNQIIGKLTSKPIEQVIRNNE
ncbi:MAG: radical SAM family heme chaperone HemW [Oscillospiraceae bacterium]|nr:radical SAM family heme chaperone HemW [Oscillospiraceae bacterium]